MGKGTARELEHNQIPGAGLSGLLHMEVPYLEMQWSPGHLLCPDILLSNQAALGDVHVYLLVPSKKLHFQSPRMALSASCQFLARDTTFWGCTLSARSQVMHVQGNPQGVGVIGKKGTQGSTHLLILPRPTSVTW